MANKTNKATTALPLPHANRHRHGQVLGLAGWSGSGKTTLMEKLITEFTQRGLSVASIKHAHHSFDPDTPNKDSWRHRKAGAQQVLVASHLRRMLVTECATHAQTPPSLNTLLSELAPADIVLVEGFKATPFTKIEIRRDDQTTPPLYQTHLQPHQQNGIVAIASDKPLTDCPLPVLDLNDIPGIADFILTLRDET
ncbi:MAG: molybdopterin-guanine dinucleotide biosynthesis protein B [Proteobacteria bacterium]|nr:molybdopterin-guanine dinucleotide biosynthesis protein B [Pseudomonadota bacterium]